jgi:hypothetical protein
MPIGDREIVHPYLASTASVVAHWTGMHSFHAGAFLVDGRVWGLLGARGAGKSSLLAHLALEGFPIFTDDVLVLRDGSALAGPRCVDLRAEPASVFKVGEALGIVGTRERWRLAVGPVPAEAPLAGWLCLGWGSFRIGVVTPQDRIAMLLGSLSLRVAPADPSALLDLVELPMLFVRRKRDFKALDSDAARLIDHLSGRL